MCIRDSSEPWLYPISPTNLAPAVTEPVLLLAGRTDQLISVEDTEALASALAGEVQLEFYDAGHQLPTSSVQPTIDWLVEALIDGRYVPGAIPNKELLLSAEASRHLW